MIIVEEKRLKMSFEEKRDWISYGKWMISLTPLDVTVGMEKWWFLLVILISYWVHTPQLAVIINKTQ